MEKKEINKEKMELLPADVRLGVLGLAGHRTFDGVPGDVKTRGSLYYHFFNSGEEEHPKQKNENLAAFEYTDQKTVDFDRSKLKSNLISANFDVTEQKSFVDFIGKNLLVGTCKSNTKSKITITDDNRIFYGIFCIDVNQNNILDDEGLTKKELKNLKKKIAKGKNVKCDKILIKVISHIYTTEDDRDLKFDEVSDEHYKLQFNSIL